jgi:hypothetical protein
MEEDRDRDEIVVRGPSTRAVRLKGEDYLVSFTRDALASAVEQVQSGYVRMNVEHLSYLPPVGHWHRAAVEDDDDGHSQLVMYGHRLPMHRTADVILPEWPRQGPPGPASVSGAQIGLEPRNFEPEVWEHLKKECPLSVREHAAWSSLPPLLWLISIPVTWGAAQFTGSFLKRLGEGAASGLASWIQDHARRARDSSRDNLVEIRFDTAQNLSVSGFLPFNAHTKAAIDELRQCLDGLGPLASFAGWMNGNEHPSEVRLVAFFYQDGVWNLAWWASPDSSHITKWFENHYPDPERFPGRPLLRIADEHPEGTRTLTLPTQRDCKVS